MFYLKVAMATLVALALWMFLMVWGAASGWWREPLAPPGDSEAFMRAAVAQLERNPGNAAMVLIEGGKVVGEHYAGQAPVNRDTVFAVASLSKWLAAWGVMVLVEEGRVDLDRPVSDYLTRWKLPESGFDHRGVTVRRLLSHTAGLTDGLGWGEYQPDERVPTLEQSLSNPRASSGEDVTIAVGRPPGSAWEYSGGGYLILELLVEEVSGRPFDAFMRDAVFQPLGMSRSTYDYLGDIEGSAKSYDRSGRPAPIYRHASKAATALNTSAGDLTRFVLAQLSNVSGRPLEHDTIDAMRKPHASSMGADLWGLGTILYAPTDSGDFVFGHDGSNEPAINATARINPDTGDAIVALTTGSHAASAIGSHWVFWQTGLPDVLSVGSEVERVMPVMLGGALVILLGAVVLAWRRRRRVAASGRRAG
jgi:CubicO group peptidase (beta-lactamase class C family)